MVVKRFLLAICFAIFPLVVLAQDTCAPDVLDIRYNGSTIRFQIEVVDTPEGRAQGLMYRETMPRFAGMLFVYPQELPVSFWMRNTLIPLDMIFIDEDGVVRNIHENAVPLDETSIPSGEPVKFVLEVNGGMSAMLQLREGAEIRHPAIDAETAVWPCE